MSYRNALTERLIRIIFDLANRPYSRQELAYKYEVNAKTISRVIDALSLEFEITHDKIGREVFYKFADGYKFKAPLFSSEELAVLLLAQKSIEAIGVTAKGSFYGEQSESILRKIRKGLPTSIKNHLEVLSEVYGSAQIPEKDFSEHTEIIEKLASCAVRTKVIEILYHGLNSNEQTKRKLHPLAVYFDPDRATVKFVAFDPKYKDLRVFSVERISLFTELKEKFKRPKDFKLENYLEENCFNGIHGNLIKIKLKAKDITARIFAERKFHPSQQTVEHTKTESSEETTIEMCVAEGRGLERFILSYLPDIEVIEPKSLRDNIYKTLRASLPNDEKRQLSAKI
jgi:predicted DNA-binding transcriptional regulator YafY